MDSRRRSALLSPDVVIANSSLVKLALRKFNSGVVPDENELYALHVALEFLKDLASAFKFLEDSAEKRAQNFGKFPIEIIWFVIPAEQVVKKHLGFTDPPVFSEIFEHLCVVLTKVIEETEGKGGREIVKKESEILRKFFSGLKEEMLVPAERQKMAEAVLDGE
jgi:hypothetical protein